MGQRYYSPELCRFIQPDDIEYLDPSSINSLYIGSNIVSSVGTIAGNIYMKYNPPYPGRNPNKIPDGFNDRVNEHANYYNPKTDQSLRPDLSHPEPYGPHWDWKDSNGVGWRLYRFWRKIK